MEWNDRAYAPLASITSSRMAAGAPYSHYVVAANDSMAKVKATADYCCDGVADNVQIQAALDAANADGGGVVELAAGTYDVAATLLVYDNMTFRGQAGAIITVDPAAALTDYATEMALATFYPVLTNADHTNGNDCIWLDGIYIDMDGESMPAAFYAAIWLEKCRDSEISRCRTDRIGKWKTNPTASARFGILVSNCFDTDVVGCQMDRSQYDGLRIGGSCRRVNVLNCTGGSGRDMILTCGKDVSAWVVGDVVRNFTGSGDIWTGVVAEVNYNATNTKLRVTLAPTKTKFDVGKSTPAQSIENVTHADNTTISGVETYLANGQYLIQVANSTTAGSSYPGTNKDILVSGCRSDGDAIAIHGETGTERITIENCTSDGLSVLGTATQIQIKGHTLTCTSAINITPSAASTISNVRISDCKGWTYGAFMVHLLADGATSVLTDVLVDGCVLPSSGVKIHAASTGSINRVAVNNCTFSLYHYVHNEGTGAIANVTFSGNVYNNTGSAGYGVYVRPVSTGEVTDVTIDGGIWNAEYMMYCNGTAGKVKRLAIRNAHVQDCQTAMVFNASAGALVSGVLIQNNDIVLCPTMLVGAVAGGIDLVETDGNLSYQAGNTAYDDDAANVTNLTSADLAGLA